MSWHAKQVLRAHFKSHNSRFWGVFENFYENMRKQYNNRHWVTICVKNYKRQHKVHMISSKRPLVCLVNTQPYCICEFISIWFLRVHFKGYNSSQYRGGLKIFKGIWECITRIIIGLLRDIKNYKWHHKDYMMSSKRTSVCLGRYTTILHMWTNLARLMRL